MDLVNIFRTQSCPGDRNEAFHALLAESWGCIWPNEVQARLVQWRYYDEIKGRSTLVAFVDGRGAAMIDAISRPYILRGQNVGVRETGDWYCREQYRTYGLGLHLIRRLMRDSTDPILVIGGSQANRVILSKLWHTLPSAYSCVLPVKARGLLGNLIRLVAPAYESFARILGPLPFRYPRQRPPPYPRYDADVLSTWQETPCDVSQDLVGVTAAEHFQHLTSMPAEFGQVFGTIFRRDGVVVGSSLAQTEATPAGKDGKILRLQTVADPDAALLQWMIAVTSLRLVQRGAEFIRCRASTPAKLAALRSVGYRFSQEIPCFWFDQTRRCPPPVNIDLDYMRGDDAQPMQALIGLHMKRQRPWRGFGSRLGARQKDLQEAT